MARSTWGSKRQKSKGVWELRYTVGGKPKSTTFRGTAREADRELAALRMRYEGRQDDSVTIDAFFWGVFILECETRVQIAEKGLEGGGMKGMSPVTLSSYIRHYNKSIRDTWCDVPLGDVRAKGVQAWLLTMTCGAARHALAVFRAMMNRAQALEYVESHPLGHKYVMPASRSARERVGDVFGEDELVAILDESAGEWWRPLYVLSAFGGAQRAEAVGVQAPEVSYIKNGLGLWGIAPVKRGVHLLDGKLVVVERAKNKHREASLVIPPPYSSHLKAAADEVVAAGGTWLVDDGFGGPVDPEALTRAWTRWLSRSTHRYVPWGNLRNSYSTMLHSMGLEDSTVSKLLRHANLKTDYAHYNRIGPEDLVGLMSGAMAAGSGMVIPDRPISGR